MAGPDGQAPDSAETEASLLARAQSGDVAAFERLSSARLASFTAIRYSQVK